MTSGVRGLSSTMARMPYLPSCARKPRRVARRRMPADDDAKLAWDARLLRRDAGVLEDLAVALGVGLVDRIKLSRRGRCRDRALREQFLLDVRHLQNFGDVLA